MSLRYLGLTGSLVLAVAAWLGGARPHSDLASTPVTIARGPYGPVVLCGWAIGTGLLAYAWWAARDRIPSPRWAVVTGVLWAAPFLFTPPMGSRDVYSYACQGYLYEHGLSPYENPVVALPCPWLSGVPPIWRDTAAPYGPFFVMISGGVIHLSGSSLVAAVLLFRLVAVLSLAAVAFALPVIARRCGVPARQALWVGLAGPLIGPHLIGGPHNDALMAGLLVAGLAVAASARNRPALVLGAGVLLGLAVAVKVTAIVVVPFALLLVSRRGMALLAAGAVAAAAGVTALSGLGVGWVSGMLNTRDLVQFTSPPTAVGMTVTYLGQLVDGDFDAVPAIRGAATVLFAVLLVVLFWRCARSGLPPLHGAGLALAATVALSPYFHPWYATWPLLVLAATTVRTKLIMAVATASSLLVLPDGSGLARFVKFPGAPIVTVVIIVLLVRRLRRRPTPVDEDSVGGDSVGGDSLGVPGAGSIPVVGEP